MLKIRVQLIVLHHLGKYNGNLQLQLSYLTDPLIGKHILCFWQKDRKQIYANIPESFEQKIPTGIYLYGLGIGFGLFNQSHYL